MKLDVKISMLLFLGIFFITSYSVSCSFINPNSSKIKPYWNETSSGGIETNDKSRLQNVLPFKIVLPKYLPDEFTQPRFYKFGDLIENQLANLEIYYYSSKSNRELIFTETLIIHKLLEQEVAGLFIDYTPIKLSGIQIFEKYQKNYIMPKYLYSWDIDNMYFYADIYGYEQADARKIIESMIK